MFEFLQEFSAAEEHSVTALEIEDFCLCPEKADCQQAAGTTPALCLNPAHRHHLCR